MYVCKNVHRYLFFACTCLCFRLSIAAVRGVKFNFFDNAIYDHGCIGATLVKIQPTFNRDPKKDFVAFVACAQALFFLFCG